VAKRLDGLVKVSERRLNRALLARQLLLERRPMPVSEAVGRLVAIQAQYSPSPYLALHARLARFRIADLESALANRSVVKATLMRATLHVVAGQDYPAMAAAWQPQWLADLRPMRQRAGVDEERLRAELNRLLATPRGTAEIVSVVRACCSAAIRTIDALMLARALLPMVHVPPSGYWRQHGPPETVRWTGRLPPEPAGTRLLIERYLAAFGPATREDLARFSGLRYGRLDPALADLEPLRRLTDESGRHLLDLPDSPLPDEDFPAPVRFLPKWDAALLSYADRGRILPDRWHDTVMRRRNGELLATFLVDGMVVGTWSAESRGGVAVLTLVPLDGRPPAAAGLEAEAQRLVRFIFPRAQAYRIEVDTTTDPGPDGLSLIGSCDVG
jgi:hypothetical protein